ncbi:MAG TPA: response regulator [Vicinamibacterales bacterium]
MTSQEETVVLWSLRGHGRDVRCLRQRTRVGLELRVLWGDELFLTETFKDSERLMTRADEFRSTLEARGWRRMVGEESAPPSPGAWLSDGPLGVEPEEDAELPPVSDHYYSSPDAGRRPTVLIVDDETTVRSFLRSYLEEADYAVCEAGDVDSALSALDDTPVDAVVLDVRMPDPMGWGRTGLEVLAFIRLHAAFAALPVLVLTGHALEIEEQDLIRRHRAHLFLKPDGYRTLLLRLDQLTGRREINRH